LLIIWAANGIGTSSAFFSRSESLSDLSEERLLLSAVHIVQFFMEFLHYNRQTRSGPAPQTDKMVNTPVPGGIEIQRRLIVAVCKQLEPCQPLVTVPRQRSLRSTACRSRAAKVPMHDHILYQTHPSAFRSGDQGLDRGHPCDHAACSATRTHDLPADRRPGRRDRGPASRPRSEVGLNSEELREQVVMGGCLRAGCTDCDVH